MKSEKTSLFANGLIWFGAGVSIAEILTGTYIAPLGLKKGLIAIILGHIIGALFMFAAGYIGAKEEKSAMETVKMSFGTYGSLLFCVLNILQLVGWTAIMIYDGALAANGIISAKIWVWALVIGLLILLWIAVGIKNLGKVNTIAMSALFILTLVLCKGIFIDGHTDSQMTNLMTFGGALELSIAMPLSWLPLISDYTRNAKKPVAATAISVTVYGLISTFMYVIGMGAALYTGETDIAKIMMKAGPGVIGLFIIVLSTVTTTFLDAYSAGVSCVSVHKKIPEKWAAIVVTIVGTIAAAIYPMDNIMDFLLMIGSVFTPMIAIQIADYFILKKKNTVSAINVKNLCI